MNHIDQKHLHITVDSEPYSGGEQIARELGRLLNLPCYAGEILDTAAELSGIPAEQLHRYDGRAVREAYDLLADDHTPLKLRPAADFLAAQLAACRKLAAAGPCILVDRHASKALSGSEGQLRIFIHGDPEARAAACAAERGLDAAAAAKQLGSLDRRYRRYYRSSDRRWGEAEYYDLAINGSGAAPAQLAANILTMLGLNAGSDALRKAM